MRPMLTVALIMRVTVCWRHHAASHVIVVVLRVRTCFLLIALSFPFLTSLIIPILFRIPPLQERHVAVWHFVIR